MEFEYAVHVNQSLYQPDAWVHSLAPKRELHSMMSKTIGGHEQVRQPKGAAKTTVYSNFNSILETIHEWHELQLFCLNGFITLFHSARTYLRMLVRCDLTVRAATMASGTWWCTQPFAQPLYLRYLSFHGISARVHIQQWKSSHMRTLSLAKKKSILNPDIMQAKDSPTGKYLKDSIERAASPFFAIRHFPSKMNGIPCSRTMDAP